MAKILVIDDEQEVRDVLGIYLSKKGHEVIKSESGSEGLDVIDQDSAIDLIILDNRMPGMKGIEVLQELQKREANTPVILLTGSVGAEEKASDATMLLRKPIDFEELLENINKILTG